MFASMGNHPMLKRHANNMSGTSQQQQPQQPSPSHSIGGHNLGVLHQTGGGSQPVSPVFNISKLDDLNNNNNNNNNTTVNKGTNIHHHHGGPLASGGSVF